MVLVCEEAGTQQLPWVTLLPQGSAWLDGRVGASCATGRGQGPWAASCCSGTAGVGQGRSAVCCEELCLLLSLQVMLLRVMLLAVRARDPVQGHPPFPSLGAACGGLGKALHREGSPSVSSAMETLLQGYRTLYPRQGKSFCTGLFNWKSVRGYSLQL